MVHMKKTMTPKVKKPGKTSTQEARIGVTDFKARCLALIDAVERGKTGRVVLLKRGRPVAELRPIGRPARDLWGAMAGSVRVAPSASVSEPLGEPWKAER